MGITVSISAITGTSPFDVYICQGDGSGCFFIAEINTVPYNFEIPPPYDTSLEYMVKVVDGDGCQITGVKSI